MLLALGYSGWGPGQLDDEIQRNGWLHCEADEELLFGNDLGAVEYDPSEEFVLMAEAGMSFRHILASLTTAPAERFGESDQLGRIAAGLKAWRTWHTTETIQACREACGGAGYMAENQFAALVQLLVPVLAHW